MTDVRCHVESCWLSAHADDGELTSFAAKLQPQLILPVHGDGEAREGLARSLLEFDPQSGHSSEQRRPVWIVVRGDRASGQVVGTDRPAQLLAAVGSVRSRANSISNPSTIGSAGVEEKAAVGHARRTDGIVEVAASSDRRRLGSCFANASIRSGSRSSAPTPSGRTSCMSLRWRTSKPNFGSAPGCRWNRRWRRFASSFRQSAGLLRAGFYPEEGVARLEFDFPHAVRESTAAPARRTGNQDRLARGNQRANRRRSAARRRLAEAFGGPPTDVDVSHENRVVHIGPAEPCEFDDDFAERFLHRTGYRIECVASDK